MNKAILTGRTVKELELRTTQSGTSKVRFTLAVERIKSKEKGTDFVPCIAYGKIAELLHQYVRKGQKIGIVGQIQTGSYDKDGRKIYTCDVIVNELEFLEAKKVSESPVRSDGDLPF